MLLTPRQGIIAFLFLVTPALTLASTIQVNGVDQNTGVSGASSASLSSGESTSGTYNFTVDGGLFEVFGDFSASNPSGGPANTLVLNATAIYEGTTPLATDYTFSIDALQDFTDTTLPSGAYIDSLAGFTGPLGSGSSLTAEASYDGQDLPSLVFTSSGYQSNLGYFSGLTNPLTVDYTYTFDFAAGTAQGASMTSTPEPAGVFPVLIILALALGISGIRRSRQLSKVTAY